MKNNPLTAFLQDWSWERTILSTIEALEDIHVLGRPELPLREKIKTCRRARSRLARFERFLLSGSPIPRRHRRTVKTLLAEIGRASA